MPYISTEEVKKIRVALKEKFPKAKFSVRRDHYSSVYVTVYAGPVSFDNPYHQVNHFYPDKAEYTEQQLRFVKSVLATIQEAHGRHTESEDGDYGSIPNYYLNVTIGSYDKPYVQKV